MIHNSSFGETNRTKNVRILGLIPFFKSYDVSDLNGVGLYQSSSTYNFNNMY